MNSVWCIGEGNEVLQLWTFPFSSAILFHFIFFPLFKKKIDLEISQLLLRDFKDQEREFCFRLCPLISPVTFWMTLWCWGSVLLLISNITQLTFRPITVAIEIVSLMNSTRKRIIQKPEVILGCLCILCSTSPILSTWHDRQLKSCWTLANVEKARCLLLTPFHMDHPDARMLCWPYARPQIPKWQCFDMGPLGGNWD